MVSLEANPKRGLVLTAGGARGAYQAGVLKRIGELSVFREQPLPFPIVVGASAGAINSAYLAADSSDFSLATKKLAKTWHDLKIQDVFRTDIPSLGVGAARWIRDLSCGGFLGGGEVQSLLDASPLRKLLERSLPMDKIQRSIENGHLFAVAIAATSYYSGKSVTFIQGKEGHPLWSKARRASMSTPISIDHVMASCAIPVVFQPVKITFESGEFYFGDGALRMVTPFSPAIRLGARRIFAIGIRSQSAAMARSRKELDAFSDGVNKKLVMKRPPLAQVFGTTLNAIFLDHLDTDLDHLNRINELIRAYHVDSIPNPEIKEPMHPVDPFVIHPSADLAQVAELHGHRMPRFVRYLMEGLGASRSQSADLMSYLLFDSNFTRDLISIGYQDAHAQIDEIEHFLMSEKWSPTDPLATSPANPRAES
jgi:NTE family protein